MRRSKKEMPLTGSSTRSKGSTAFWLTLIPGLVGLFGLGHLYLRRFVREFSFIGYSIILCVVLALIFTLPWTTYVLSFVASLMWIGGLLYCMFDVRRVARRVERRS
ncbi:MAG: hypothetical protein ACHQ1H_14340 [Nitrososphaerales archaeon]